MPDFLKDYEPVEDRLRAFWSEHPEGRVVTVLVDATDGNYIVRAEVFRSGDEWPAASGLARDSVQELPPNMKASALEVCETSAIGRALANLGYAAKGKRPSREEMSKASPAVSDGPKASAPAGDTTSPAAGPPSPSRDGVATKETNTDSAGDTTSVQGEVAGEVPGGQTNPPGITKDAPGPPIYSKAPADCNHKGRSGNWLAWRRSPRGYVCPRCGLSRVSILEGTDADLGAA